METCPASGGRMLGCEPMFQGDGWDTDMLGCGRKLQNSFVCESNSATYNSNVGGSGVRAGVLCT